MRVLVGNNRLRRPGGSETFTYALVNELVRKGHDVTCVTTCSEGMTGKEIAKLGVPVIYERQVKDKFDIALLSHTTSIALARRVKAFKVQTCHGIYPKLEQPVIGMNAYVSISDEVHRYLKTKGIDSTIIANGVDCNRFRPEKPINDKLETVLSLSHSDMLNGLLRKLCQELDIEFVFQNKYREPIWDIEQMINYSDMVVSLGRGAYESMACGRNVFVLDNRQYVGQGIIGDGILTQENIRHSLKNNCSGRQFAVHFDYESIKDELKLYHPDNGYYLRDFALNELNIERQAEKYLKLVR